MVATSASNNWLALFVPALKTYADRVIIRPYTGASAGPSWGSVTFREWNQLLAAATLHWRDTLAAAGFQPGDVIGVWLTGRAWTDLLHICGVAAAGFVPQLFSAVFAAEMITALLALSGAQAVVFDADAFPDAPREGALPAWPAPDADALRGIVERHGGALEVTEADLPAVGERDACAIFHSSGTTSGLPKLIPTSHLLMKTFIEKKFPDCLISAEYDASSYVYNSLGSLAHVGSFQCFHAAAAHGACTVQPSSMAMAPAELLAMVRACGLNALVQYGTFVSAHIRAAAGGDTAVAGALAGLRQILYTGVALPEEDWAWAGEHGLPLSVMFGASETAPLLVGKPTPGRRPVLRPCAGASPLFIPYASSSSSPPDFDTSHDDSDNATSTNDSDIVADTDPPSQPARPQLYELVVAPSAPDAPPAALFSADGLWHTRDLFERARDEDGGWVHRGRTGDWIKTVPGFVDTRAIEDAVRATCAHLVADALVVGAGRAHPALLVEPAAAAADPAAPGLAQAVVARIGPRTRALFAYERVRDARWVLVVPRGGIVRTREKGNARREATEARFRAELDALYAAAP